MAIDEKLTDEKGRTLDQVLALVKAGMEAATSLLPFILGAGVIYRQVIEAWKVSGMSADEVKAHIVGSEADVRDLVAWWEAYEPVRHPDSKL